MGWLKKRARRACVGVVTAEQIERIAKAYAKRVLAIRCSSDSEVNKLLNDEAMERAAEEK
jgi:hypothetical protein